MLPNTRTRVPEHTSEKVNRGIRRQTELNIAYFAGAGKEAIDERLAALDQEWDIERMLEANAASLAFIGVVLGAAVSRKWLILPGIVTGFLLQHALQGWCPPLPVFRRMGIRTTAEIDLERAALKALRGDFENVSVQRANRDELSKIIDAVQS